MAAAATPLNQAQAGGPYGLPSTLDTYFCSLGHAGDGRTNFLNVTTPGSLTGYGNIFTTTVSLTSPSPAAATPVVSLSADTNGDFILNNFAAAGNPPAFFTVPTVNAPPANVGTPIVRVSNAVGTTVDIGYTNLGAGAAAQTVTGAAATLGTAFANAYTCVAGATYEVDAVFTVAKTGTATAGTVGDSFSVAISAPTTAATLPAAGFYVGGPLVHFEGANTATPTFPYTIKGSFTAVAVPTALQFLSTSYAAIGGSYAVTCVRALIRRVA